VSASEAAAPGAADAGAEDDEVDAPATDPLTRRSAPSAVRVTVSVPTSPPLPESLTRVGPGSAPAASTARRLRHPSPSCLESPRKLMDLRAKKIWTRRGAVGWVRSQKLTSG